jgi:hypothetical protein
MYEKGRDADGLGDSNADIANACGVTGAGIPLAQKGQGYPAGSFTRTAIEVPEFGNRFLQWESSPRNRQPNYLY